MVGRSEIPSVGKRTDTRGRQQPASQPARPRATAIPQSDLDALNNAPRVLTVALNGLTAPLRAALVGIPAWSDFTPSVRSHMPSVVLGVEPGLSPQGTLTSLVAVALPPFGVSLSGAEAGGRGDLQGLTTS